MKFLELQKKLKLNLFTLVDVLKLFPDEKDSLIKIQLSRFSKKKLISKIKRGLYCFDLTRIDELELANKLYQPSYITLETALNYYGLIPDIPQMVTSVNLITTKKIINQLGVFQYTKIRSSLFFGFTKIKSPQSQSYINLALKEKTLLDYFYLRKINNIDQLRLDLGRINLSLFKKFAKSYPLWVRKIIIK
jgi:predicted transcriptional regulator of viral defense system